jgi:hypothetical protein
VLTVGESSVRVVFESPDLAGGSDGTDDFVADIEERDPGASATTAATTYHVEGGAGAEAVIEIDGADLHIEAEGETSDGQGIDLTVDCRAVDE